MPLGQRLAIAAVVAVVAGGVVGGGVRYFSTAQPRLTFDHSEQFVPACFSPDGRMLAGKHCFNWGITPQEVSDVTAVWDVATGRELDRFEYTSPFSAVFTPQGQLGLVDDHGALVLRDPASRRVEVTPVEPLTSFDLLIVFSPDGRLVAYSAPGSKVGGPVSSVYVDDLVTGVSQTLSCNEQDDPRLVSLAFSADSRTLGVVSVEGVLQLWDVATGKQRARFRSDVVERGHGQVYHCQLSPDLRRAFFLCRNNSGLWRVSDSEQTLGLEAEYQSKLATFSEKGRAFGFTPGREPTSWLHRLLSRRARGVLLHDLDAGERPVARLPGCIGGLFSPDCTMFAAISLDGTIQLWDVPPREPVDTILGLAAAAALLAGGWAWWFTGPTRGGRRPAETA
jgi:WD40 repeat protein